jgi:TonB family protein
MRSGCSLGRLFDENPIQGATMNIMRILSFRMPYILSSLLIYGSATPQDVQPTPRVETPVRVDPKHPIKLGENYPALSRKKGEEGLSVVRIEVDADGVVRATQLVFTSGFARLDAASLGAFAGARMIPATIDGEPVNTWANIPIAWNLAGHGTYRPHKVNDAEIQIPIIVKNYRLKVGPNDYPSGATHREGDCTIRALIDKGGTTIEASVSKSTGFATLDQACVQAIQQAPFIPAHQDGEAIGATATINMNWRLTQSSD